MTPTGSHVGGAAPYDVRDRPRRARRAARRCSAPGVRGSRSSTRRPWPRPAQPVRDALAGAGYDVHRTCPCPTARRPSPPRWPPTAGRALGAAGFTRSDAVVGVGGGATTDLGGLHRRDLAARRAGRARADDAARHGRRRRRRQDRHQHRRGQEPRRRLPRAGRRALRPDLLATLPRADSSPASRGRQVRLHRRPGDPRRWSRPTPSGARPGRSAHCAS